MSEREGQSLGYLLNTVAAALRSELTAAVLEPLGLSFQQYICMRLLSHSPGRSNAELARDTHVSPQAMNIVVRGLEERGLVTRPASVASGRALPAELSRDGVALLRQTDSGVRDAEARVLAPLTARDQQVFRRILAELG